MTKLDGYGQENILFSLQRKRKHARPERLSKSAKEWQVLGGGVHCLGGRLSSVDRLAAVGITAADRREHLLLKAR